MRIGLVGPLRASTPDAESGRAAEGDDELFREAASFLLGDADADQIVFLGEAAFLDRATQAWARSLGPDVADEARFLARAAELAASGTADALERLLDADAAVARLSSIRKLPPPPARAVELVDDRVVLFVHDKAVLDEEDIANAHLVVYGRADESAIRRFGRRVFFTPGPLSKRQVGLLEASEDGVALSLFDLSGEPVWREAISAGPSKMTVAS